MGNKNLVNKVPKLSIVPIIPEVSIIPEVPIIPYKYRLLRNKTRDECIEHYMTQIKHLQNIDDGSEFFKTFLAIMPLNLDRLKNGIGDIPEYAMEAYDSELITAKTYRPNRDN